MSCGEWSHPSLSKNPILGVLKHKIVFADGESEPQIVVGKMPDISSVPICGDPGDAFFLSDNSFFWCE